MVADMRMPPWSVGIVLVGALTIGACTGTEVSAECRDAFSEAATTQGDDMMTAMTATLDACESYDAWLTALREQGPEDAVEIQGVADAQMELMGFCTDSDAPVCTDARDRGIIQ